MPHPFIPNAETATCMAADAWRYFHLQCGIEYPPVPDGMSCYDSSWGNDQCPSYTFGLLQVFFEHEDGTKREADFNEPGETVYIPPRYSVYVLGWENDDPTGLLGAVTPSTKSGETMEPSLETDNWDEVLDFVREAPWGPRLVDQVQAERDRVHAEFDETGDTKAYWDWQVLDRVLEALGQ